jgi:ParB-like chromosome segregation protein Spo0J
MPTNKTKKRSGDALGKVTKRHGIMSLRGDQVVVIGHDTDKDLHDRELAELKISSPKFLAGIDGVWSLASPESNDSPVSERLGRSIESTGRVEVPGKVIRVPLTQATQHLAYVDNAGQSFDFYLAVVYGRKRTRCVRDLGLSLDYKVASKAETLASVVVDMLIENLVRRKIGPIEEGRELEKLQASGAKLSDIAARLGDDHKKPSIATVANKIKLASLAPEVAALVSDGKIKVSHGYLLGDLDQDRQLEVANQVVAHGLTHAQTKALIDGGDSEPKLQPADLPSSSDQTPDAPPENENRDPEPEDLSKPNPNPEPKPETKTRRPKLADIEAQLDWLAGPLAGRAPADAATLALKWVLGQITKDQLEARIGEILDGGS